MVNEIEATAQNVCAHMKNQRNLFHLKIVASVLASVQLVAGIVGFVLFYIYNEEFVPRFKNHMEPLESKKYTLMLYSVDFFMGILLFVIWKPVTAALRFWIVVTCMGTFMTAIGFFWALPYGYSTSWQAQLLFDIGLVFRILEVVFVRKFYFDYTASKDEILPFVKPRVVNTWPARRPNSDVPIDVIPIN